MTSARENIRRTALTFIARGDTTGWFEQVYADANGNPANISWADLAPNPHLMPWIAPQAESMKGRRALVVGCGLGDDAEALASLGLRVTAFDIAQTAINWCKQRFPASGVDYVTADATSLPSSWAHQFDLVVEIYTLQVLVPELRSKAADCIAGCVRQGGSLLIVARGREESDPEGAIPWPLTKAELDAFTLRGLDCERFEDFMDGDTRRFRAVFQRV
ncbi:MAG: class I SAM-dependent methyltransferase [Anaerolineae bacterium]|nr:class I SAM-dependent methyltransferase [Anaerolineae bacterium]